MENGRRLCLCYVFFVLFLFGLSDCNIQSGEVVRKIASVEKGLEFASDSASISKTSSNLNSPEIKRDLTATGISDERTRLLIAKYYESRTSFNQFDLQTQLKSRYKYLRVNNVLSLTYDPTTTRILFSRETPAGIFSSPLDDYGVGTFLRGVNSEGMTVDVENELLFFTTFHPNNSISRVSTSGDGYQLVKTLTNRGYASPRAVSVDSGRRMIYFTFRGRPWSMDYNGNGLQDMPVSNYGAYALSVDVLTNTLYYNDDKSVMKRDLASGDVTQIQQLNEATRNVIFHNNTLYMCGWDYGRIYAISVDSNEKRELITLSFYDNVFTLIP